VVRCSPQGHLSRQRDAPTA